MDKCTYIVECECGMLGGRYGVDIWQSELVVWVQCVYGKMAQQSGDCCSEKKFILNVKKKTEQKNVELCMYITFHENGFPNASYGHPF